MYNHYVQEYCTSADIDLYLEVSGVSKYVIL
jgi:hypothetical protein